MVIARAMDQYITQDKVTAYDYQRQIIQFHEESDIGLGQCNHYAVNFNGLYYFVNDDVPNTIEVK